MIAMLVAMVAFSIDAMLPALPAIGADLSPASPESATLVIGSFILGLGIGQFPAGPISDVVGRKPAIIGFMVVYVAGAVIAAMAGSLEVLLVGRCLQGFGAAGPRIVALAVVRDRFAGERMAKVMSFVMMVFTVAPAAAPSVGAAVMALAGWRAIFVALLVFAVIVSLWFWLRQPETLSRDDRRKLSVADLLDSARIVFRSRQARLSTLTQALLFGALLSTIASIQPIFDQTFGRADTFHFWFGGIALGAAAASLLNAAIVEQLGMLRVTKVTLTCVGAGTLILIAAAFILPQPWLFTLFILWATSIFAMAGLTIGNVNAVAMEPLGGVAGMAASVIGGVSTVAAALIATPVGLSFDGTPLPLFGAVLLCVGLVFLMSHRIATLR